MGLSGLNTRLSSTIFVIMLSIYRIALIVIALLSELINVLYHRGSFYILQVYRRVFDLHWSMDAGDVQSSSAGIRPTDTSLIAVLSAYRGPLIGLALFSALINVLYLTGSFYMLQVYDRVIPSRSVPTLIALSLLAGALYAGQAALDFFRGRILLRMARSVDEQLSPRVFALIARLPLSGRARDRGPPAPARPRPGPGLSGRRRAARLLRSALDAVLSRNLLPLPSADRGGGAGRRDRCSSSLTACTEVFTRKPVKAAALHGAARNTLAEASRRNAEVMAAMGMTRSARRNLGRGQSEASGCP